MTAIAASVLSDLETRPNKTIVTSAWEGRRGHPVLFRRQHFEELMTLDDDVGAQHIATANETTFRAVPTNDAGILSDIDVRGDAMPPRHDAGP